MRKTYRVTDCLGSYRSKSRNHAGLDLNSWPIGEARMTAVVAPGTIKNAGWRKGYGCSIMVQHNNCPEKIQQYKQFKSEKCVSFYAHLKMVGGKCPAVSRRGQKVNSCEELAPMGNTGGNYPVHLHFELRNRADNLRLNSLIAIPNLTEHPAFHEIKNPEVCEASQGWIAYSPLGKRMVSVGAPKNAVWAALINALDEAPMEPWPDTEPASEVSDAEVEQAAARLFENCQRSLRNGSTLGGLTKEQVYPADTCRCLTDNMKVARNVEELDTVAKDYVSELKEHLMSEEESLYIHEATKLEANCLLRPTYKVGEPEPRLND